MGVALYPQARVYLSKKIAISSEVHVRSVCWNPDEDWIAFGGQDGLTKVFKLEQSGALGGAKVGSAVGLSNFSMNQVIIVNGAFVGLLLGVVDSVIPFEVGKQRVIFCLA